MVAQDSAGRGQTCEAKQSGNAKVCNLDLIVRCQQQIGRLNIPVNNTVVVGVLERPASLHADVQRFFPIESSRGVQFLFQTRTIDEFHRIEERAIVMLAPSQETNDSVVLQDLERFDLGLKPLAESFGRRQLRAERLDGNPLPRVLIDGLVYRAHSSFADPPAEFVRAQLFVRHGQGCG